MNDSERAALVDELAKWMNPVLLNRHLTYEDIAEEFVRRHIDRLLATRTALGLDELLDSVGAGSRLVIRPESDGWTAIVGVRRNQYEGFTERAGHGPTRTEALRNAVAQAAGITQEGASDE